VIRAVERPDRPWGSLTREQKVLVRDVPGLAEKVAYDHLARFGCGNLEPADLVQHAHLGIYRAAQLFNESKGVPFDKWAYFKAACAVFDAVRKSLRLSEPIEPYRTKAGQEYLAARLGLTAPEVEGWVTEETLIEQLVEIAEEQLGAELTGAASALGGLTEEERAVARLDWGQAYAWLEQLLDDVEPEYRRIFARCHAEEMTLEDAIAAEGLNYWAALRELPKLFKRLRARFSGLGLKHLPESHGEWGSGVLKSAAAAWAEGR
jgi:DNA-directed RNA polymerase specialized sigma24 family protein